MISSPRILGIAASLRNARSQSGVGLLLNEIGKISDRRQLLDFLADQARVHLEQFVASGRADSVPFDTLYRRLRKIGGLRGLSNSEVCLVAALWAARNEGAEIDAITLIDHFPADGSTQNIDLLKAKLAQADGIIVSTPVYFGDRSSLSQRLIETIRADNELKEKLKGKVYGGLATGAKRNGGQETTLIYQMVDMVHMGLLAVGNNAETTSQYGGTGLPGDIGTMADDEYGIKTSIGTGQRIAHVCATLAAGLRYQLRDQPRVGLWTLQDKAHTATDMISGFLDELEPRPTVERINFLDTSIRPCIACDICPTHVGPDEEYRCIIGIKEDGLKKFHRELMAGEIMMPVAYSPKNRYGLESVYQQFMERTRYLRRSEYAFADRLVAPVVISEVGSCENLNIRMMTSFIRHHTVVHKPIIGWIHDGRLLNPDEVRENIESVLHYGRQLLTGHLGLTAKRDDIRHYNPVGYVLSREKSSEESAVQARRHLDKSRRRRKLDESEGRLTGASSAK
jgi:multimeric flavodoxin WrbA